MRRWLGAIVIAAIALIATIPQAMAWNPGEALKDPALEARARSISSELRCLVCQNQSIDNSDAELARDLRILVRERLSAGDTDEEVFEFLVARYGEFVLLKPRFNSGTYMLWGLPILLLAGGSAAIVLSAKRRKVQKAGADLSDDEKARLASMIDQH